MGLHCEIRAGIRARTKARAQALTEQSRATKARGNCEVCKITLGSQNNFASGNLAMLALIAWPH